MTTKSSTDSRNEKIESHGRLTDPRAIPQKPLPEEWIHNADAEIPVGDGPITVVFSREGDLAFVLNNRENSVTVIDVRSARPIKTIEVGSGPRGASASPNGRDVVVCHGNAASVIDCSTLEVRAVIEGVSTLVNTPFSPDGKYVYFCSYGDPEITIVDAENLEVVDRISLEGRPDVFSIVLSPSKPLAYISNTEQGEVLIFHTQTWALIKKVKVGQGPTGLAISSDGELLVGCNFQDDTVSFIRLNDDAVVGTVRVGPNPIAVVFSPDGHRAYVADGGGDTVSVIDAENFERVEVLPVGPIPYDVAINPEGTRVYTANVGSGSVSVLNVGPSEIVEDFESVEPTQIGGIGETMLTDIFKVTLLDVSDPNQYLAISNADWGREWVSGNALNNYDAYTDKMMTYSLELIEGTASTIRFWVANGNNTSLIPYLDVWFMHGPDNVIDAQHFSWPRDTVFEMQVDSGLLQGIQAIQIRTNGQFVIDQITVVPE